MRITFILPGYGAHGGVRVVVMLGARLREAGHEVKIVYEEKSTAERLVRFVRDHGVVRGGISFALDLKARAGGEHFFRCPKDLLFPVRSLAPEALPAGDVLIATAWRTAALVADAPAEAGEKFYFLQHYETWDGSKEEVDATWRLPLKRIVVSSWLEEIATGLGVPVAGTVVCGFDPAVFSPRGSRPERPRTVGMLYHVYDWKGVDDGLAAVAKARARHGDLRLLLFGAYHPRQDLPPYAEFHFRPKQSEIPELYNRCHVWLCPSWCEGGGLPSQEAMACGCAVVSTDVGSVRDFGVPGESVLVSPPRDPDALAANLVRVLDDPALMASLAAAGLERIQAFSWRKAAARMEAILAGA